MREAAARARMVGSFAGPLRKSAMDRAYATLTVKAVNEDQRIITGIATTPSRVCPRCKSSKPVDAFSARRAHCRACYNVKRRQHYANPGIRAAKNEKRRSYEHRVGLSEKRKVSRQDPEFRLREKAARDAYRLQPGVKERLAVAKAARRATPASKAQTLWSASKLRAAKRGLPFDIPLDWVIARVTAGRCEMTGLEFDYARAPNGWRYNPRSPSIDQIAAGEGYTTANCRVVLTALNNALSQYGDDHFEEVAIAFLLRRGYQVARSASVGGS
jgi:hypothetical protein